eukprot:6314860-Amphidinium_carterae.1
MNCKPKDGYDVWISLAREYEPQIESRSASYSFRYHSESLILATSRVRSKWENQTETYDCSERRRVARNQVATLLAQIPKGHLQEHLLVNATQMYPDMRAEMQDILPETHRGNAYLWTWVRCGKGDVDIVARQDTMKMTVCGKDRERGKAAVVKATRRAKKKGKSAGKDK